ncbi:hypothetical protein PGO_125830 [Plasmodium gonderi]|uniref:Uncharacterized protein n=1 Tax=Plasmodium gonderi TaxID=77519 RepID=A0A1Y1JM88_PLAGO|nr:hypothetical protein PGO_125830 [Plasmodium gonderi]GAW82585.1 hypothetical protein PGO_125830 [Plasmodium gonderi]
MIISPNCDLASGFNDLRSKNIDEISEIIKKAKEEKENHLGVSLIHKEKENINVLKTFTESQAICYTTCKENLYKRFERDIEEYKNVSTKNNINFHENKKRKLEKYYQDMEHQMCFHACSKMYFHLLQDRL